MSLKPGIKLGPYEITAQVGEGGMGEVYQATDTNLKRQVAIKVLPESVAGEKFRISTNSGRAPVWGRNGRELFYLGTDAEMIVDVATYAGYDFRSGVPRTLFNRLPYVSTTIVRAYDVSPNSNASCRRSERLGGRPPRFYVG